MRRPSVNSRLKVSIFGLPLNRRRVQLTFFVASGVSRIICLRRAFEKLRQTREFEPTHVGCYVMIDELDAALDLQAFPRVRWALKLMDSEVAGI